MGDILRGRVVAATDGGLFLDLDGTPGWVRRGDLLPGERARDPRSLVGTEVEGAVIEVGGDPSSVVISPLHLARARLVRALERQERLSGRVATVGESGIQVDIGGVLGFIPRTELHRSELARGPALRGHPWRGYAIEIRRRRFVLSSLRPARRRIRDRVREHWIQRHRPGDEARGRVVGLRGSGALVRVGPGRLDALVPRNELSWFPVPSVAAAVREGQRLRVKLLEVRMRDDRAEPAVIASLRAAQPNPWPAIASSYPPGTEVECRVTRRSSGAVSVHLAEDPRVQSYLRDEGPPLAGEDLRPGSRVLATVRRIDVKTGRLYLEWA